MAVRRLKKELKDFEAKPLNGTTAKQIGDDWFHWKASIQGLNGLPYEGGTFELDISYPQDYPFKPPKIKFITKIYHANISERNGNFELSLLNDNWTPRYTISNILAGIVLMLCNVHPYDSYNPEAATLYRKNETKYNQTATKWTKQYAGYNANTTTNVTYDTVQIPFWNNDKLVCSILSPYMSQITIKHIFGEIRLKMAGISFDLHIKEIKSNSFIGNRLTHKHSKWNEMLLTSITKYNQKDIVEKGLKLFITNDYRDFHKIYDMTITCQYLQTNDDEKKSNDEHEINPPKCPIYIAMKEHYNYNENNLTHLYEFTHFHDEYNEKPICKYAQKCKSFIRLQNGDNRLDDRCHIKLYRHPPRNNRQIMLSENINKFICNQNIEQNQTYNAKGASLDGLIGEVIQNGYKYDLCLECSSSDDCKHSEYSILKIVDDKLNHQKHKQLGSILNKCQMLALILYTGCDCNYDLCKSQRNDDYNKWQKFDYCLYSAIKSL
eukprot:28067_1